jgi:hypothetical protein
VAGESGRRSQSSLLRQEAPRFQPTQWIDLTPDGRGFESRRDYSLATTSDSLATSVCQAGSSGMS